MSWDYPSPHTTTKAINCEWNFTYTTAETLTAQAIAKKAKELGLDAIHDTVHEMARDEARHGKALKGLLERYFK